MEKVSKEKKEMTTFAEAMPNCGIWMEDEHVWDPGEVGEGNLEHQLQHHRGRCRHRAWSANRESGGLPKLGSGKGSCLQGRGAGA